MPTIKPDITLCVNIECDKRDKCYKYRAIPNEIQQSYSIFDYIKDKSCFWYINKTDKINSTEDVDKKLGE